MFLEASTVYLYVCDFSVFSTVSIFFFWWYRRCVGLFNYIFPLFLLFFNCANIRFYWSDWCVIFIVFKFLWGHRFLREYKYLIFFHLLTFNNNFINFCIEIWFTCTKLLFWPLMIKIKPYLWSCRLPLELIFLGILLLFFIIQILSMDCDQWLFYIIQITTCFFNLSLGATDFLVNGTIILDDMFLVLDLLYNIDSRIS